MTAAMLSRGLARGALEEDAILATLAVILWSSSW